MRGRSSKRSLRSRTGVSPVYARLFLVIRTGPYSRNLKKTHAELKPHYFELAVLDKYRNDPNYSLRDHGLGTNEGSGVPSSGLQQFVWGHKSDGSACIMVFLVHLCALSAKDQVHWKLHEIDNPESVGAKIDARYIKPIVHGQFRDTISIYEAVHVYMHEIQKFFHPDVFFPNFHEDMPLLLAPLTYNSKKAFLQFIQDLFVLIEYDMRCLAKRIKSDKAAEYVEKLQRRNLLELYFREKLILPDNFDEALSTLKEINALRVASAHKLTRAQGDKNYMELQVDLVDRLQRSLGNMMFAFAEIEKGSEDVLSKTVSEYKVVIY
jgi:hypothetical protein